MTLASVAVLNASRYLRALALWAEGCLAVHQRKTVALARGILMVRHGCSTEDAFQILVQVAAEQDLYIHEMASDVVAGTER